MRYRSKPSEVDAVQWTGTNLKEVQAFAPGVVRQEFTGDGVWHLEMRAGADGAQGWVEVPVGHWLVRQPDDLTDHWPVEDSYFQRKYEVEPA